MNFEDAWALTMSWEGGSMLHTIPGDPGGTTRYGLSQRAYPDLDLADLSLAQAQSYARKDYWLKVQADSLPSELRWHVFDTAFNSGVERAGRILQRAANMHRAYLTAPMIVVDGRIGPITVQAAQAMARGFPTRTVRLFKAYRIEHYLMVAQRTPQFIHGWLRRAEGEYNG